MNFGEKITPETPEEIADYEVMYKRKREKEKPTEPKTKIRESGLMELDIKVPGLVPENAEPIMRDIRHALENCGRLDLLDEFVVTLKVEYYEEALIEGAE